MIRSLAESDNSGIFFRVRRDGSYQNLPIEDLSKDELDEILDGKNEQFLARGVKHLVDYIKQLKDQLHHRVKE